MSLEMQHRPHSFAIYNHCWQDAPHFQTTAKYVHLINSTYFPVYVHIYMWAHMYTHANGCQRWRSDVCFVHSALSLFWDISLWIQGLPIGEICWAVSSRNPPIFMPSVLELETCPGGHVHCFILILGVQTLEIVWQTLYYLLSTGKCFLSIYIFCLFGDF